MEVKKEFLTDLNYPGNCTKYKLVPFLLLQYTLA
jgi:hypothetical protein